MDGRAEAPPLGGSERRSFIASCGPEDRCDGPAVRSTGAGAVPLGGASDVVGGLERIPFSLRSLAYGDMKIPNSTNMTLDEQRGAQRLNLPGCVELIAADGNGVLGWSSSCCCSPVVSWPPSFSVGRPSTSARRPPPSCTRTNPPLPPWPNTRRRPPRRAQRPPRWRALRRARRPPSGTRHRRRIPLPAPTLLPRARSR